MGMGLRFGQDNHYDNGMCALGSMGADRTTPPLAQDPASMPCSLVFFVHDVIAVERKCVTSGTREIS